MINLAPILLTFKLAAITTIFLFFIAVPISYWLSSGKSKIKTIVETLISMPLVLPPTVLGFYFLLAYQPSSWLNQLLSIDLLFTFEGLVIASILYSLPFMVQPITSGLKNLPSNYKEASYVLGKSKLETLVKVLLPNCKPALLTGIVLSFAHTIGEFGVVLMIGGNIPGETKVASIAIYDEVEGLNYAVAHQYSFLLFIVTFSILLLVNFMNRKYDRTRTS